MPKVIHIKNSTNSPDEVYIGRAGKGKSGYFGNPIKVNEVCYVCNNVHTVSGETIACYEIYLQGKLKADDVFKNRVKELYDKTLVCFCAPKPCHGDVLARAAIQLNNEEK